MDEKSGAKPTLVDSRSPRGDLRGLGPVGMPRGVFELTVFQISFVHLHPFGRSKNPEMRVRRRSIEIGLMVRGANFSARGRV